MKTYVIGDIHGYFDKLMHVHDRICEDALTCQEKQIILLGDYFDRGPQSREVYEFLISDRAFPGFERIYLRGNHEQMLCDALTNTQDCAMFLRNGGQQTVESFAGSTHDFKDVAAWIQTMPYFHEQDGILYVHAGVDPRYTKFEDNSKNVLMWIRDVFLRHTDPFYTFKYVIHGHTPTLFEQVGKREPIFLSNRINMDTGVCFDGNLSCLLVENGVPYKFTTSEITYWKSLEGTPCT